MIQALLVPNQRGATRVFPPTPVRRSYGDKPAIRRTPIAWTRFAHRHGIAESGSDYALGDAFPHDVLLDQTGGVGFRKGCYVGQEVVSRMQHRGTARRPC
jgi:folate-binding protein YgfZ